jgi:hypothetical protein
LRSCKTFPYPSLAFYQPRFYEINSPHDEGEHLLRYGVMVGAFWRVVRFAVVAPL